MELKNSLRELAIGNKSKRLRPFWSSIEAKLADGASHAEILTLLDQAGFELTERTYKSYLYRDRKRRRSAAHATQATARVLAAPQSPETATTRALPQPACVKGPKRPPTFDYDPRGIPDLLK